MAALRSSMPTPKKKAPPEKKAFFSLPFNRARLTLPTLKSRLASKELAANQASRGWFHWLESGFEQLTAFLLSDSLFSEPLTADMGKSPLWLEDLADSSQASVSSEGVLSTQTAQQKASRLGRPLAPPVPEEEFKRLLLSASCLEDVWLFLLRRLKSAADLDFLALVLPEQTQGVPQTAELAFIYPLTLTAYSLPQQQQQQEEEALFYPALPSHVSLLDALGRPTHLAQALQQADTTFAMGLQSLGPDWQAVSQGLQGRGLNPQGLHLFSVPFIAGGKTVALLTFGFTEVDSLAQAKLSYIYGIRDALAQLIWNLLLQERTVRQGQNDALTGLPHHSHFLHLLEGALENPAARPMTLMLVDINNLEALNQEYGYQQGDAALCQLTSYLRGRLRPQDVLARYGGDELAVLLSSVDEQMAGEMAERFLEGLQGSFPNHGANIPYSISIGYACFPADAADAKTLRQLAGQALHLAKFRGSKTGLPSRMAASQLQNGQDEKTVLEVFASHVAKKLSVGVANVPYHAIYSQLERAFRHEPAESLSSTEEALMLETIGSLAGALEAKDRYTRGHSQAVSNYSVALAHGLGLSTHDIERIRLAALLHDIGKIGIPESILNKTTHLTADEWLSMQQHPTIGSRQILSPVSSLADILPLVEHHHERWDGSGYPSGLQAQAIPLGARIIAVADAFHAMTSDRSYRKALPLEQAIAILEQGKDSQFDAQVVNVFLHILKLARPASLSA